MHYQSPYDTVTTALRAHAAMADARVALRYSGRSITYGELLEASEAAATGLRERGLCPGDRIALQLQNMPQFVIAILGAWLAGLVGVPISPMYRAPEVRKLLVDSGARALVTANETWSRQGQESITETDVSVVITTGLAEWAKDVPVSLRGLDGPDRETASTTTFAQLLARRESFGDETDPNAAALLCYTSGTTGPPKGAEICHGSLAWSGAAYSAAAGVGDSDQIVLGLAPLVHITGLTLHLAASLVHGSRLVLSYRFDASDALETMATERVTWTTGAATAYIALLRAARESAPDLSSLRFLGSGGAPVPTQLAAEIGEVLGTVLHPGYGLTEATSAMASSPVGEPTRVDPESGVISVGPPIFDTVVRIVDEDGKDLPVRERGEILIQGPGVMRGYWERPLETAATIANGWLHTGDIGFVDSDGWLYIVDRTKNLIIASGYKVWPREVEDVLYMHPAVREAAVIGIPDPYRGETVTAFVSLTDQGAADANELIAYAAERLAAYKVPKSVAFLVEIPKNSNGKIVADDLRRLATTGVAL